MTDKKLQHDLNLSEMPQAQQDEVQLLMPYFLKGMLKRLGGKFNLSVENAAQLDGYTLNIRVYPGEKRARLELTKGRKKPVDQ